ncbi:MAG TPA: NYN domain-containing protein [Roseiflexaceae bacterium]|nr:NYN domain-containing protein [Roseiflexaceae bacterium]
MNLLVDGHNLIGQMPGLSLADEDDEARLVQLLRGYAARKRGRTVVVVFDHGVYGHPAQLNGYGVSCHFARSPQDADAQIIRRLRSIRGRRDWAVVTADREIARAAAEQQVRVIDSRAFARQLSAPPERRPTPPPDKRETPLTPAEVEEWLRLFGERGEE